MLVWPSVHANYSISRTSFIDIKMIALFTTFERHADMFLTMAKDNFNESGIFDVYVKTLLQSARARIPAVLSVAKGTGDGVVSVGIAYRE
jgi:hypothetical protein